MIRRGTITREGDERVLHFVHLDIMRKEDGDHWVTQWNLDKIIREEKLGDDKKVTSRCEFYSDVKLNSKDLHKIEWRGFVDPFLALLVHQIALAMMLGASHAGFVERGKFFPMVLLPLVLIVAVAFPRKSRA